MPQYTANQGLLTNLVGYLLAIDKFVDVYCSEYFHLVPDRYRRFPLRWHCLVEK